ncbi:MAG: tail fiber domain-containing protein [Anaerolineales bacterium]
MKIKRILEVQLSHLRIPSWRSWLPSRGNILFTLLVVCCLIGTSHAWAAPQSAPALAATSTGTIPYQGRLTDTSGGALNGAYTVVFRLYNVASGGSPLWEEYWTGVNSVQVANGLFNVMLGSLTPIPQDLINGNNSLWLGIDVGSDAEMTPRVQLGSAPYAFQANHATMAERAYGLSAPDGSSVNAVYVDKGGYVGIGGTTSPVTPLSVGGVWWNPCCLPNIPPGTGITTDGSVVAHGNLILDKVLNSSWASIQFGYAPDGSTYIEASEDLGGLPYTGDLTFWTHGHYPDFAEIKRMTIDANGNVGIGTTNPPNILTIAQGGGNVLADGYSVYSSKRWKENIAPIGDALSIVQQLRGVTFDWKGNGKHDLGLIAEEVGKVLPQIVTYEANGQDARGVDYSRLVAVLVEATKEQQTTITSQQQQISAQQQQNATQQQQIAALDARLTALERSGGAPAGQTDGWNLVVILTLAGGLLLLALIVYRFRSKPVRS